MLSSTDVYEPKIISSLFDIDLTVTKHFNLSQDTNEYLMELKFETKSIQ